MIITFTKGVKKMDTKKVIVLGADHAGYEIKEFVKKELSKLGYTLEDIGTDSTKSVDYPDFAEKLGLRVAKDPAKKGILTCVTGIGASIAANKIPGINAALVHDEKEAILSIEHNNVNVLVLGGRPFDKIKVKKILLGWLNAEFLGGRHTRRINKIKKIEKKYSHEIV